MSSMFEKPASASGIQWEELRGRLLLIEPTAVETEIPTTFGPKDAVRAKITIVDGDEPGAIHPEVLIFPTVLKTQTRGQVGKKVLGRLGVGNAKAGQKPPWRLEDATDADIAAATEIVKRRDAGTFVTASSARSTPAGRQSFDDDTPPF